MSKTVLCFWNERAYLNFSRQETKPEKQTPIKLAAKFYQAVNQQPKQLLLETL